MTATFDSSVQRFRDYVNFESVVSKNEESGLMFDTLLCAQFVEQYLDLHTNHSYPTLDKAGLERLCLQKDPFHIPFLAWTKYLIDRTSPAVLLLATVYIRRALCPEHTELLLPVTITSLTVYNRHRVLLIAVIIASKYLMDVPYSMQAWSQICQDSWTASDLCIMEEKFIARMKWSLYMSPADLIDLAQRAERCMK
eukprot:TRINITY_DN16377_c0_g1::TRINITY_DN16377_c0_g1_i1::g.29539::m.29539 TRINITY_DN16377_c0_g1::TRINITY_DN16377_c0_g1_i1::g.29539  ORF type:complete len:196 (-),score=41.27,Cyclin/PF08613.6/5e-09,Cyclin_N/PF00134.18/6.9e-06 TRINITY_DN16377_c0_g1_i1:30-617(-)